MAREPQRLSVAGDSFMVRVTPKSGAERLIVELDENGAQRIKVHVTVAPEDGKANKAVIALLAKALGVPKSALSVAQGATARDKLIRIAR